jgi:hypothetical protein
MNKRIMQALALALLAVLLLAATVALAQGGTPAVGWWVIDSGGGLSSANGVTLQDKLGQPIIGPAGGGNVFLGAGYLYGVAPRPSARPVPVGGYLVPVRRVELLAPWLGLAAAAVLAMAAGVVALRRRRG